MVDEAQAVRASGPIPRVASRPLLRPWLCSGRAARFLWVCASGKPDANLRLTLTAEGSWPAFLDRREPRYLDVQVEDEDGATRWISGFDIDTTALVARLCPEARVIPQR